MLSEIQKQKARRILDYGNLPMFDTERIKREQAYGCHVWASKLIDTYNLPYRVLYNYLKENGYQYLKHCTEAVCEGVVLINRCYPYPGYLKQNLMGVSMKADYIRIMTGAFDDDATSSKFDFRIIITDESLNAEVEAKASEQHTWDLSTAEGLKVWKYEFAHFLGSEDFKKYTLLDWFGRKTEQQEDQRRISYWKTLQKDYLKNPTAYRQTEPLCSEDDKGKYTLWEFYWSDIEK